MPETFFSGSIYDIATPIIFGYFGVSKSKGRRKQEVYVAIQHATHDIRSLVILGHLYLTSERTVSRPPMTVAA
jgi:hypothetical protein